jgi:hypothetical protein
MGRKLENYTDGEGNTVRDGDTVIYIGKEFEVIYISDHYVNIHRNDGGMHVPFSAGIPVRKFKNFATKSPIQTVMTKKIVSGQFGVVSVESDRPTGNPRIKISCVPTSRELRQAAEILLQIADFIDAPKD